MISADMLLRRWPAILFLLFYTISYAQSNVPKNSLFSCPPGWELRGLHCYKYFTINHSWENAAQLCNRYGSELALIESYSENNFTAGLISRSLGPGDHRNHRYWLGLTSLDDLRTNTLETAGGVLISQYAGFWSLKEPDVQAGECVDVVMKDENQSWRLQTCETLLPFLCRATACPTGSFHCSNGRCVNSDFRCDKQNDCGDWSDELDCPSLCHYYMASSGDVIESSNYPHKYDPLSNCRWTLEGPQGHNILLQFQEFETEKSFDTVQILVGGRTDDKSVNLATLSGKLDLSNKRYVSASNFMIVKFSSDGSVEKKGFRASWKTEPQQCGGMLRATTQPQVLQSPGYPQHYPGGLECLYTIEAQPGHIVTLEIEDIKMEANQDYVLIRDGDNPNSRLLGRLTGTLDQNPRLIMSTGSQLYLYMKTNLGDSTGGLKLKYSQGCRSTLIMLNGTISSPAFGLSNYPSNVECLIRLKNPSNGPLSLKFDFLSVHQTDVVQVYDGGSTSGLRLHSNDGFHGNAAPKITMTASSGEMLVRFISDALHNGKGWRATFSADCPVLQSGEGAMASNRDTAFGTVVTFTCPVGQEFATGKSRITTECLMGGNWSVSYIPRCQEVYCGPVPQIDNGFSIGATNVTYRGVAYYQCYAGFGFPSGQPSEKIFCLADGRWERLPSCQASQCPPLSESPRANATILNGGGRSYGTIVRFECEPGYMRVGHPVLLCMSNGTWSSPVPTCIRAECPKLPEIAHGFVVDAARQYLYGDEARVQCHRGFKLTGAPSVIKCGADQKFSNVPKCEDINECASSQCDVASTECMNTAGAFYCKCRSGFSSNMECRPVGDLGLMSGGLPDDAITVSASEPGYSKEFVRLSSNRGWCGTTVEPGSNWIMLDMKAPTILRGFRTQGVMRVANKYAFTTAIRIQYTNNLTDVFKDYTNPDGTPVEFRILEPTLSILNLPLPIEAQFIKFKIQDYIGMPCLRLEVMGCTKLECMDINECAIGNGGCDQKCINSASNYSCACNTGFELFVKNETAGFQIDPSETGDRDGDIFQRNKTCVPVMCPKLHAPENGVILSTKEKYHFGDLVTFQCNFGYVLVGSNSLLCGSSAMWNGTVPQCQYAKCVSLPDDKNEGLFVLRPDKDSVLVPFKENVTMKCSNAGRTLRKTATSSFRQCVYDPKPGLPDYWLSGVAPSCPRVDCGPPTPTPGAEYGNVRDTKYHSSFFFGCQDTFKLAGQTDKNDNVVRCQDNGVWDFGDLRCEGPVCEDPGRPTDGFQLADSYEQDSEVLFGCNKPGYILINPRPITCIREPECKIIRPLGLTSGRIPDSAINATSERPNYEARNIRLNSVTGWCGKQEAFTYVSVDLGHVHRIKAILVKGVVTNDIVGRPTEIRFFYKQSDTENFVVYFPNFNLTMRDPGNYGELAMITLPKFVQARYVILGIVSYMDNACLKFELMGCDEPAVEPLLGYNYGYSPCVDNEPPVFQNCPSQPIVVRRGPQGIEPVNITEPVAVDNSGSISRLEVKPPSFRLPYVTFHDMVVKYIAFDYDGNVAICEINITVADETPPQISCPQSYVIELVDRQDSYTVNFNETRRRVNVSDASGDVTVMYVPERATIPVGDFQNVTVVATDKFGNAASCHFQVSVQATSCVNWELTPPANGALNCLPGDKGLQCVAICNQGYRFTDSEPIKTFTCDPKTLWSPSSNVPDCVSEDTQQADYHFVPGITYRANGAVSPSCLPQYVDLVAQYFGSLDSILTQKCSAINVPMNVTILDAKPSLVDDNLVLIDYILGVVPAVRQPQLYELCGSTLNLIFDLSVSYASASVEPLLNVSAVGSQCPPLRALRSGITRGFSCNIGEVLTMDPNQVPRCLHCPAGTSAGINQNKCALCARGFYQDKDRQGSCVKCPQGTYTKDEGSKSISDCVPVCGYGTYSPTGLVPCLECPKNTYTTDPPLGGYKECNACPASTFTYQTAAPHKEYCRAKCMPGHYSETGLAPCAPCPSNFFQPLSGQTMCMECPSSTRTKSLASAGREECQSVQCTENSCLHGGLCVPMGHAIQCFCPAGFSGRRCEIDIDECASQPCYNGGLCVDLPQGYKCQCRNGYSGINCQEEKSDCKNDTCPARAMCKDEPGVGNFTCLCRTGYTGPNCDVTVDPCVANGNPCENDAKCLALKQGRYKCECLPGWEGQHCENNIDDCAERPCLLGAACTDLVADFKCACPPGFTGKRCETKIDLCADNPCQNGICVDKLFSHQCICHPGWKGAACQINIDDCEKNPCQNGGECTDLVNDFRCTCDVFYTGKRCQHLIDDCSSSPCQNGGSCVDMLDGFVCNCRPGFVGLQCEAEIDECLSDPCDAVGTERCLDLDNKYKCVCHPGYTGENCQVDIDDCATKPCLNDGKCVDGVNKYTCKCPPGWTGARCELDVATCQSTPCQNDARCINLFQDFFCVCPSGTDGKQCETAPERCIGNPCMHGGSCQDFGSGLNCSCSADFSGVGCQYEFDACQANVCQNGASCVDNGHDYQCLCPPGFTGKNCETDIEDCQENSCPPTATCIDLTDRFYCQCPFNLTGEDCRKPIQVDYDLSFPEASASSAALSVPFHLEGSESAFTIAMWVQFARRDEPGVFFSLYSVTSGHVASGRRLLVQAHSSGVQISLFPEIQDVFLPFQEYATINDGQWHHIAIVWNRGTLTLVTEGLIASKVENYGVGKKLPEYGWVVLGKPRPDNVKAYTEPGFEGFLSKVQVWARALDVTNEIQKQVRDCRTEPILFEGLALQWSGYDDINKGVERIVPSQCSHHSCPAGYTGAQCDIVIQDKTPPKVEYCPGDLWVIAKNGSAAVTWDEPRFDDNVGVVRVDEQANHQPGHVLTWGNYHIAYVAFDAAGNSATCSFKIYVLADFCPPLADPVGGKQQCKDWGYGGQFKVCEISCNHGLKFSQPVPKFYSCGAEGFWRPTTNPSQTLIYPACSPTKPAQRVFKVGMKFPTSVLCNEAGQGVLRQKVRNAINSLNREWNLCSNALKGTRECKDLVIDVKCEHRNSRASSDLSSYRIAMSPPIRREKRETSDAYSIQISFPSANDPVTNLNSNQRGGATIQQLLEKLILEEDQFDVHDILPNTVPDAASLVLNSEYACLPGQVVVDQDCVPCAVGSHFDKESGSCVACSAGTYQSETGQMQCNVCPNIAGRPGVTASAESRSVSQCKERCVAGKYYDEESSSCRSCGHGFYQPEEGTFKCLFCGLGKTTRTMEAVSQTECRDECASGMQLGSSGECEPCPRGTYRTQGVEAACQSCPQGRTTSKIGATFVEDCALPICKPGTYLNGTLNSCSPCKKGTYQPNSQQTSCLACPPNTSTKGPASTSKTDCWNPCDVNESEMHCDANAYCLLTPETHEFKCECKPGFNGTGKYCTDVCNGFCQNKGTCVKDTRGQPSCRCVGSFIGVHCEEKSEFAYIAGGIAATVVFLIIIALFIWMICARSEHKREPKKLMAQTNDQTGSQVNFYYGAAPYAESIAPSHHSTYAHYYDDEEDGWEMPNYYNETYMKETLHGNGKMNSLARSNASIYGNKDDLYDRLKRHAYPGKKDKSDSESEGQ